MTDFFTVDVLPDYISGITTRKSGLAYSYHLSENFDEFKQIETSRTLLLSKLNFSYLITLKQIHSDVVHIVNKNNLSNFLDNPLIEGDGLITALPGVLIGVSTADCVPIFYLSEEKKVCGVVHAGWRGIYLNIHRKTLEIFKKVFSVSPDRITVVIGPHIKECCYTVGEDMFNYFDNTYFIEKNGCLYLNLDKILIYDFNEFGVKRENIKVLPYCSYCDEGGVFYSYRKGDLKGRNLAFIGIRQDSLKHNIR